MTQHLLKITDHESGDVYWLNGDDKQDAYEAFGQDITIELFLAFPKQETVQHTKRGSIYEVFGRGRVQTSTPLIDYDEVVVYFDPDGIWVRPVHEFDDSDRFVKLETPT